MPLRPASATRAMLNALIVTAIVALTGILHAQAVPTGPTPPPDPSRIDIYGGYGYIHPVNSDINNFKYQPINPGAVVSIAGYFNRYIGLQAEGSFFPHGPNDCIFTAQAGPIARYQKGRFVPFLHVLGGGAKVGGPAFQPCTWGWGLTAGAGLDYILPVFNNHLAIRPIQADFDYSHVNYGPLVLPGGVSGGTGDINAYRLSAGVVLRLGTTSTRPPVQLGCTVKPVAAYAGDPVEVTAVPANLDPHRKASYSWTSTGGKIGGFESTATLATAGLAAGDYTITGHVSEGTRPSQQATCTASVHVRAYEPPTISCSANPSTVTPGDSSIITSSAHSPQNRPLTYSYTTTSGQISGSGSTVTLGSSGASSGTITVTCNAVDDLGQQASSTTAISVSVPPAAPEAQAHNLCSVAFERDRKRPVRVDNEGKACLDDVALTLDRDSSAKLVIVAHHDPSERPEAAQERALHMDQYLADEKGIDSSRIELRTGDATGRSVETTLVPAGANFDAGGTTTFDASSVKQHGPAYGKAEANSTGKKIR